MHSYLKTIGFSNVKNRIEMSELLKLVISKGKKRMAQRQLPSAAELTMEFAEGIGITVYGEYDEKNEFHVEHFFPFYRSSIVSTREELFISKRVDTDAYTGMCDDYRLGVSLIFYLQNVLDFLKYKKKLAPPYVNPVILSALALEGKILLPVEMSERQIKVSNADIKHRNQLISEAKKGNQEAIDSLTIGDIDTYSMVSKRIQTEDIYSIVDTSFIPYGSESDNYTILGTILDCQTAVNKKTKEEMFTLQVECNQINFEICINKKDLLGEPIAGRRFKGIVWMQGYVDFSV